MSAVNNHNSSAMRVLATPRLNEHLLSFMSDDSLERLKLASKRIPQEAVDKVIRKRVYKALDRTPIDKHYKEALLNFAAVRNFPGEVPGPLFSHGASFMTGLYEAMPGRFSPYVLSSEHQVSRSCCLPNWHHQKEFTLRTYISATVVLSRVEREETLTAKECCFYTCMWRCYHTTESIDSWEEAAEAAKARGPAPQVMN